MKYYFNTRMWGVVPYNGTPSINELQLSGKPATETYKEGVEYYLVTSPINGNCPDTWLIEKDYFDEHFVEVIPEQYHIAMND